MSKSEHEQLVLTLQDTVYEIWEFDLVENDFVSRGTYKDKWTAMNRFANLSEVHCRVLTDDKRNPVVVANPGEAFQDSLKKLGYRFTSPIPARCESPYGERRCELEKGHKEAHFSFANGQSLCWPDVVVASGSYGIGGGGPPEVLDVPFAAMPDFSKLPINYYETRDQWRMAVKMRGLVAKEAPANSNHPKGTLFAYDHAGYTFGISREKQPSIMTLNGTPAEHVLVRDGAKPLT